MSAIDRQRRIQGLRVTAVDDDLFAPEVIANPYPYFAQLRKQDPVHWNEKHQVWVISRYEDLVWVARNPGVFSSAVFKNHRRPLYPEVDESDLGLYEYVRKNQAERLIQHDPPEHTAMRKVVHSWFDPNSIERWRPMVRSAIKHLLDAAEEKGRMDVLADFATPLPVLVIAEMLGLPHQDREFMRQLAIKTLSLNQAEPGRLKTHVAGVKEMEEYLAPLIEERVANPRDDLLSVLASGEREGVFTREQVLANADLLLVAGHETTINLICNGTLAFIRHPDQWEVMKRGGGQMLPPLIVRATEECLRYDSPLKSIRRIASEDVELGGKSIRKLDCVRWFISSANRDPEMFPEPDKFDITRWPNQHVAFGSGVHHCVGASLARLEGQEVFKALVERFPSLYLEKDEKELEYQAIINFRSLKSLPVSWN